MSKTSLLFLLQIVCFLSNVPGMLKGHNLSFFAGGMCLAFLIAMIIDELLLNK